MTGRPRVMFVTAALEGVGGIASYSRSVIAALERQADVKVVNLTLSGSRTDQVRGFWRVFGRLVRSRPDLLVLGHVGFGPIGLLWKAAGGRYTVMAYGIEIWVSRNWLLYRTLRHATAVWPISTFTRTEVLRTAPGAPVGPVLAGTIDGSFFQRHESSGDHLRVAFVATLADLEYKGVDTLIAAAQRVAEHGAVEVRIIGSGPATDELVAYVDVHDHAGVVRVVGRVGHIELLDEYRKADALVLMTRFARGAVPKGEGLGLVLLEAAAAETPVVGSRYGGSVDTIIEGETGYLLEPGDVDGLVDVLGGWMRDRDAARAMGRAGRAFVEQHHSFEAFAGRVAVALEQALEA